MLESREMTELIDMAGKATINVTSDLRFERSDVHVEELETLLWSAKSHGHHTT